MEVLEIVEKPLKKTYQKHKTDKKIGINFYLNKNLKGKVLNNREYFPVYYQINFNGMNTKIPAESFGKLGVTEDDFKNDIKVKTILEREKDKKEQLIKNIFEHFKSEYKKELSIKELVDTYHDAYVKPISELLHEYLNNCLRICLEENIYFNKCKESNTIYELASLRDLSMEYPEHYGFNKSPQIALNLISIEYPQVYNFLTSKYPSQIWILADYIDFFYEFDKAKNYFNTPYTWYDFETGRLKRFLDEFAIRKNYLTESDLSMIFYDLSQINYFDFSENTDDFFSEDKILNQFSEYLKF